MPDAARRTKIAGSARARLLLRCRAHAASATLALGSMLALLAGACTGAASRPPMPPPPSVQEPGPDSPRAEEVRLHALLNEYRIANHLAPVPLSPSLSKVARAHAADLSAHGFNDTCSIHSWSVGGPWTPCCYDMRRPNGKCMWNKPRELSAYQGVGFEIAYRYSAGVRAGRALQTWRDSPVHNAVILNLGGWREQQWRAVGVGIDGEYATVWWGEETDPAADSR